MPYRHAHWVLLALLAPLVAIGFWPDYFGKLPSAPFAFHAHGLTALAWLCLVTAQSWSIHTRRNALHRKLGLAVFVVVPLFVAGATLVFQSMAAKFLARHPFYGTFGPMLGLHDVIATLTFVAMVALALRHRRKIGIYAGYMLGTALLVLPPVIERLPPLPHGLHLSEGLPLLLALILAARNRKSATPMLVVAAVMAVQIVQFHTIGASAAWARTFGAAAALTGLPLAATAIALAALTLLPLWTGWKAGRRAATT